MRHQASALFFLLGLSIAALVEGCGGSAESTKELPLAWPEPPDTARIAYVRTLRGQNDFAGGIGGVITSLAGSQSAVRLARPFDVCVADNGRLFITDAIQGVILYDMTEKKAVPLGGESVVELRDPRGIAYARGKLFIGLAGQGKIAVLDRDGKFIRAIGRDGTFPNPVDVVCDTARNRIYVVDSRLHEIFAYSEAGDSLFTIGKRGDQDGEFNYPVSAALDSAGDLYVVDAFNFRVQIFDSTGKFVRKFGKAGDAYGTFARPKGIALDSYGNIYVVDAVHQNFQVFNNNGEMLMFVGRYSPGNDGFENPISIAIDSSNMIYVADNLNGRVQVFQLLRGN